MCTNAAFSRYCFRKPLIGKVTIRSLNLKTFQNVMYRVKEKVLPKYKIDHLNILYYILKCEHAKIYSYIYMQ